MRTDSAPEEKVSRLEARCRERGLALTPQRRMLLAELVGRTDHPTADDVYDAMLPRLPGLSRATVYRILDTLASVGAVRRVSHPGNAVRYDPCTERHHHLVCEECGRLQDLPDETVAGLRLPRGEARGFRITDYSVSFLGTCADCRRAAAGGEDRTR